MWAVIRVGGKQYKIAPKDSLTIEKISKEVGKTVEFEEVLLLFDNGKIILGQPVVKKSKVKGTITKHLKDRKVRVVKFKPKSRYLRTYGQRKETATVQIDSIIKR